MADVIKRVTKDPELLAQETLVALITNDTVEKAAASIGISKTTIYERIHKYELMDKLKDIRERGHLELLTATAKAAENLTKKLDHENPDISLKASTEILDRVGLTKPNEKRTEANNYNFTQINNTVKGKYDD